MALPDLQNQAVGELGGQNPYLPFLPAIERGILRPEELTTRLANPPGVDIANGRLPNPKGAGVIPSGSGWTAFDHAALEIRGNEICINPAPKSAVERDGNILDEGIVVQQTTDGRLRLAALVLRHAQNPWLVDKLRQQGGAYLTAGGLAVCNLCQLDFPEYEVKDIDNQTGLILAKERSRFFSLSE